jgi:hypothetical protein
MRADGKELLWGSIIGICLAAGAWVLAAKFPNLNFPFTSVQVDMCLEGAFIFGIVIAGYRALWKYPGFWGFLILFLAGHIALYKFLIVKIAGNAAGLRLYGIYGCLGAIEFAAFAVVMLRVYHRGPDIRFL